MPLIKCEDCGRDVSTYATSCPNCGRPMSVPTRIEDDTDRINRCPVCALDIDISRDSKRTVEKGGETNIEYLCRYCNSWVIPFKTQHDSHYYSKEANYHSMVKERLIIAEVKKNPLFDSDKCSIALKNHIRIVSEEFRASKPVGKKPTMQPKCPTCGSTNIEKISTTSKVVGASLFGLFSKTARSQFKCKNCGYKW